MSWEKLVKDLGDMDFKDIKDRLEEYDIYPSSLCENEGSYLFMARVSGEKKLIIVGGGLSFSNFRGEEASIAGKRVKTAPLDHENAQVLRELFDFTNPVSFGKEGASLGLGDRLGIASPGHLMTIKGKDIKPVLAQQSIRELDLTGRNYERVLDAASWAVFQEGYRKGFGADGDHLKKKEEIRKSLKLGFSMITLDCSEHIDNSPLDMDEESIDKKYGELPASLRNTLEQLYLGKTFSLDGETKVSFEADSFKEIVLTYLEMLNFTVEVYNELIRDLDREIDFEVSIDETLTPTTPQAHYFVAAELKRRDIEANSLAPRFIGEFQKGIDYIGDIKQFEREFKVHAKIADYFGYKLSIHSGSDKFSVFPIIGKYTAGRVHVKTAGTNWLEAVRIVARFDPDLYREIHQFALDNYKEATKYYHVTFDLSNVPPLDEVEDKDLTNYLDQNDSRQLLHITYGLILQAEKDGKTLFRDRLYQLWDEHEKDYASCLQNHIGRHIKELGF